LSETRANVKSLENWVVALEFAQIPGGGGAADAPMYTARPGAPASVVLGHSSSTSLAPQAAPSILATATLTELLASDIDRLLD